MSVPVAAPSWFAPTLTALTDGCHLDPVRMGELMHRLLAGDDGGADAAAARRCLDQAGMAFCLAPHYHPALRRVGELRRRLGVRTLFNCLGPLANPAAAPFQLLGVGRVEWLDRMAGALLRLGTRRALLGCGRDGRDEVQLSGWWSVLA